MVWGGCFGRRDLFLAGQSTHPPPRQNAKKCVFLKEMMCSTVYFSRNAYGLRIRTPASPTPNTHFPRPAVYIAPCYVLPPILSKLQAPATGSTGVLPPSGVFLIPGPKKTGRTCEGHTLVLNLFKERKRGVLRPAGHPILGCPRCAISLMGPRDFAVQSAA